MSQRPCLDGPHRRLSHAGSSTFLVHDQRLNHHFWWLIQSWSAEGMAKCNDAIFLLDDQREMIRGS